jgi:hypothetical protein
LYVDVIYVLAREDSSVRHSRTSVQKTKVSLHLGPTG